MTLTDEPLTFSFHLVDGCILQMDGWCGGRTEDLAERYPDFFPNNEAHHPKAVKKVRGLWEIPTLPKFVRTQHVEMLIRRHEQISGSHIDKAAYYRRILENLESET